MEWSHYLAFNLAILVTLISPGPAFLVMMRSSLRDGRSGALRTGLGLAISAVIWTALALGGLTALFAAVPTAYVTIKLVGAGYLVWLAISIWRHAGDAPDITVRRGLSGFALGLTANLSNPKLVLFIAAIFATILPAQILAADRVLLLLNHFVLEVIFYGLLAGAFCSAPFQRAYAPAKRVLDRMTSLILGALAVRLIS